MKLLSLRYFDEVAKLGSIRRAAERLHVAPSAVSRQIAQLERDLDALLFFRTKAGVQLTKAGETYYQETRRVMLDLMHARQAVDDMRGLRRGEVTLYAIEGVLFGLLPGVISTFCAEFPDIRFTIRTASTDQIVAALLSGEADIGLTFNSPPRAEIQIIEELVEPIYCLVSRSHRFAQSTKLKLSSLAGEPMALPESSFGLRQILDKALRRDPNDPTPVITTNSLEFTKAMAMTGKMIAFMPALSVRREVNEGSLVAIPLDSKALSESRTSICIQRARPMTFASRAFLRTLKQEFVSLNASAAKVKKGSKIV